MTDTATAPAPFSFAGLSIADAEVPKMTREKKVQDNPFIAVIKESFDTGKGKSMTIPAASVPQAVYLLRTAASSQGLGSRIVLRDANGNKLDLGSKGGKVNEKGRTVGGKAIVVRDNGREYGGNVTVLFAGKTAKVTKKAAAADAPAA